MLIVQSLHINIRTQRCDAVVVHRFYHDNGFNSRLDIIGLSALNFLSCTRVVVFLLIFDYISAPSSCSSVISSPRNNVYRIDSGLRDECIYFCSRGCGKLYLKYDRHFRPFPDFYKWLEKRASTPLQNVLLILLATIRSF